MIWRAEEGDAPRRGRPRGRGAGAGKPESRVRDARARPSRAVSMI